MSRKDFRISALLLVVVGSIIAFLPRLLQHSPLNKPPVAPPIWKVKLQNTLYSGPQLAFAKEETVVATHGKVAYRFKAYQQPQPLSYIWQIGTLSPDASLMAVPGRGASFRRVQVRQVRRTLTGITYTAGKPQQRYSPRHASPRTVFLHRGRSIHIVDVVSGAVKSTLCLPDDRPDCQYEIKRRFFSPNSQYLCVVSAFETDSDGDQVFEQALGLWIWDVRSGKRLATRTLLTPEDFYGDRRYEAEALAFASDGRTIFYADVPRRKLNKFDDEGQPNGGLLLRDELNKTTLNLPPAVSEGLGYWPYWQALTFSTNGRYAAGVYTNRTGGLTLNGQDGTIAVWDMRNKTLLWKFNDLNVRVRHLSFSRDGRLLAYAGDDLNSLTNQNFFLTKGKLGILDAATGQLLSTLTEETSAHRFEAIQQIQSSRLNQQLGQAPKATGKFGGPAPRPFAPGDSGTIESMAWSPDSKKLAASYANGEIKLWRVP